MDYFGNFRRGEKGGDGRGGEEMCKYNIARECKYNIARECKNNIAREGKTLKEGLTANKTNQSSVSIRGRNSQTSPNE